MGYDYIFRIALSEVPKKWVKTGIPKDEVKKIIKKFHKAYNDLKDRDCFPTFGQIEHSSSQGYGTGSQHENFHREIVRFTEQFPDYTFIVYHCYWDLTNLIVYEIKNTQIKTIFEHDYELISIKKSNAQFGITLNPESFVISREITTILTEGVIDENYDSPF